MVCCADADAAEGERLTAYLRDQLGYVVAFYKEMRTGTQWTNEIRLQFDCVRVVVVLHSKNSIGNPYVEDEAIRARRAGTYFPVLLDQLTPEEMIPGDLAIQCIRIDRGCAPTGHTKQKFDNDIDELFVRNGPESVQRMIYRLSNALEKETRLRKLAEEKVMQAALANEDQARQIVREVMDMQIERSLELSEAAIGFARTAVDLIERTMPAERPPAEDLDKLATDLATKLSRIARDTTTAEASAERQELRLRISSVLREVDRLQRLRAARAR